MNNNPKSMRWRGVLLSAASLVLAVCPVQSHGNSNEAGHAVTGQWRLTAALDGAHMTSLDEHEARRLVGHIFTIRKDAVKFGQRVCGPSDFEAERVAPKIYFPQEFNASAAKLGLPDPVTAVDLSCTTVFIKGANRLVIYWDGWFFDAVRIKP